MPAVAARVKECIDKYNSDDLDNALIQVCIALDATAKNEYPSIDRVGERYTAFIRDNHDIITFCIFNSNVFINCRFGEYTIEQVIYKILRCGLFHEAEVPAFLRFVPAGEEAVLSNAQWSIPRTFVIGALLAVIGARSNATERLPEDYSIGLADQQVELNVLWGNAAMIRNYLGLPAA
jgi:hypothetical protein